MSEIVSEIVGTVAIVIGTIIFAVCFLGAVGAYVYVRTRAPSSTANATASTNGGSSGSGSSSSQPSTPLFQTPTGRRLLLPALIGLGTSGALFLLVSFGWPEYRDLLWDKEVLVIAVSGITFAAIGFGQRSTFAAIGAIGVLTVAGFAISNQIDRSESGSSEPVTVTVDKLGDGTSEGELDEFLAHDDSKDTANAGDDATPEHDGGQRSDAIRPEPLPNRPGFYPTIFRLEKGESQLIYIPGGWKFSGFEGTNYPYKVKNPGDEKWQVVRKNGDKVQLSMTKHFVIVKAHKVGTRISTQWAINNPDSEENIRQRRNVRKARTAARR